MPRDLFFLSFCRLRSYQMAVVSKYFSFLAQAGQGVCCRCSSLLTRVLLALLRPPAYICLPAFYIVINACVQTET